MIKLFHLFFLFLWVGTLFIMPTLLRERVESCYKIYKRFEFPCMVLALVFGIFLLLTRPEKLKNGFFHMKLTAVLGLVGCDLWVGSMVTQFAKKGFAPSRKRTLIVQVLIICLLFLLLCAILLGKNELFAIS